MHTAAQCLTPVLILESSAYSLEEALETRQRMEMSSHLSILCVREICLDLSFC